ncbi:unnamed protein product, partial [Closterium sp. NIES-53]
TSGMGLVLGGRARVVLTGHADAFWVDDFATQRSSQGYTFSLVSGFVSWRSTRSSSVLGSSCEAEIYAGAMAAQELRWLTYLLTDLGEVPRSPPVLYLALFFLDWSCDLLFSPTLPIGYAGGALTLDSGVLDDRQFELAYLADAAPHLRAMLLALRGDPDALDILTPRTYDEALSEPWASQWIAAMDPKMASWRSTGTYVNKVPPVVENVIDGMWVFKVKRPPGAQPAFKVRFIQQERVDFFLAFSPIPKMTTLRQLTQADLAPSPTGSFPLATHWSLRRPVYGLRQDHCKWHNTLRTTIAALAFFPCFVEPSLFIRSGSTLFYNLVYVNDLDFATP